MATVLCCYGINPVDIRYDGNANSTYYQFEDTAQLGSVIAQYALKRCRVEPQEFNATYVGLKDRMFTFMREEGHMPRERARR